MPSGIARCWLFGFFDISPAATAHRVRSANVPPVGCQWADTPLVVTVLGQSPIQFVCDSVTFPGRVEAFRTLHHHKVSLALYATVSGYSLDADGIHPVHLEASELRFEEAKAIYMRTVRLSRYDVVRGLKNQAIPRPAWENHPLLRDCYPLVLDGINNVFGKTKVVYSRELGVVYERLTD